mgnify:FL=1
MKHALLLVVFSGVFFFPFRGNTQNLDAGVFLGLPSYSGDLSATQVGLYFDDLRVGGGFFLRSQFSRRLGLRYGLHYGRVSGVRTTERANGYQPNFRSDLFEASAIAEVSPWTIGYYSSKIIIAPYLTAGLALFRFNPRTLYRGEYIATQPLGTEGQGLPGYPAPYRRLQFSVPVGIGIKFIISDTWTIGAEITARKTFTDYLDDRSGNTVTYGDVVRGNGELAARISNHYLDPTPENFDITYRRAGQFDDWYYFTGVTLSYRFQSARTIYKPGLNGVICPRF